MIEEETKLKAQIATAILAKDYFKLRELKEKLARERWLSQFSGNVPISAWLEPIRLSRLPINSKRNLSKLMVKTLQNLTLK